LLIREHTNHRHFGYDKTVEDFASPATAMRVQNAMNAIENSRANAGDMFSSDHLNALNAKAQAIASEEYEKAFDRYNADRTRTLNEWNANNEEKKNAYASQNDIYKTMMNQLANDYNTDTTNLMNSLSDYYGGLVNANNAYTNGLANMNTSLGNASLSENNGVADMLNFALNAFNSIMAG